MADNKNCKIKYYQNEKDAFYAITYFKILFNKKCRAHRNPNNIYKDLQGIITSQIIKVDNFIIISYEKFMSINIYGYEKFMSINLYGYEPLLRNVIFFRYS